MAWYHTLRSALLALFRRTSADRELKEEIRHHLTLETQHRIRQGEDPRAARQAAERAFGGVARVEDEVRDERGAGRVDGWLKDLKFAWRSLRRETAVSVLVVITLGFGIGATTALFAVVKRVLLTPLPYGEPDQVVALWSAWKGFDRTWLSYDEYEGWKADIPAFKDVALYSEGTVNVTGGDQPELVRSASVGENLFRVLGVSPALGRGFTAEEDRPGGPRSAILSHALWSRRYGADPAVLGTTIELNGTAVPIVGVMPSGFRMPLDFAAAGPTDLYRPLATDAASEGAVPGPAFTPGGSNHSFLAVARLAPGATADLANAQLRDKVAALVRDNIYPTEQGFRAFAVPMSEQVSGPVKGPLIVLLGAVGVVLLIACANVAGLLLVRGERRRRELAVRVALGAERSRITRLMFTETALLAGAGAVAGVLVAIAGVAAVRRFAPASLARVTEAQLDPMLLLGAFALASVTAILTGILPALQASRVSPAEEFREGGRSATAGQGRLRWRQTLVTAEVALAVVLATGAGLLVRTVVNLVSIDPGFDTRGVLTMRLSTPSTWYGDSARVAAFWDGIERDIGQLPGVRAVGSVRLLPLATEMGDWGLQVEGYTPPPNQYTPGDWQILTPGAFAALGMRLVSGRLLGPGDDFSGQPLAMVVNETFAKSYIAGRSPLGVQVRMGGNSDQPPWVIVGVVEDTRHNTLTSAVKPGFFVTMPQFARGPGVTIRSMSLVIRTDGDPSALIAPVRALVRRADPRLPISQVRTMDEVVGNSIAAPRFAMQLLAAFGVLALALSAVGIFGIVSHSVAIRQQEFGIRAALGARPRELLRMALTAGLRQTAGGIAIGVGLAVVATRMLSRVLEGVSPTDPLTFGAVVIVTAAVTLAASLVPALRASRAEPGLVLRSD